MSSLADIEAAVDQLPLPEKATLLARLAGNMVARPPVGVVSRSQRERWLQKLDRLRERGSTGKTAVPLQEVLDDLRDG